jgi:C1A family cysteine protease
MGNMECKQSKDDIILYNDHPLENLYYEYNNYYGWKKDSLDPRDYELRFDYKEDDDVSVEVDMRDDMPIVKNQGKLGSCTAFSICSAYMYNKSKNEIYEEFIPSELFLYYNERFIEDRIESDSGMSIRDGLKAVCKVGLCNEDMWEYDIDKFNERPTLECYYDAEDHKNINYYRVQQTKDQLMGALVNYYPIIFGIVVYNTFETIEDTYVKMPGKDDYIVGNHTMVICGYKDNHFIVRNSWGSDWGDEGYCYIPEVYVLNNKFASDFWVIEKN